MTKLTPLKVGEQEDLAQDERGRLYWKGKRIKTAGWTASELAAVVSAVVAVLIAFIVLLAEYEAVERSIQRLSGQDNVEASD